MAILIPGGEKVKQTKHGKNSQTDFTIAYQDLQEYQNTSKPEGCQKNSAMTPEEEKILNK